MDRQAADNLVIAGRVLVLMFGNQTPGSDARLNLFAYGHVNGNFGRVVAHIGAIHAH
ncbi:Uncharacterised protein [Klebsiella pneumoniae]|uniref:Uncharacterized protein n=1 Tax=Klebsiella pneumoniae TaxID=573 RepID=A0A377XD89_KLEPN|nr:Uncharacterised protein [Klebsiella pneumoniae]